MDIYYGIKTPANDYQGSHIWWIATCEDGCWRAFFQYPGKYGDIPAHRLPLSEAIEAYKAIGYKCVKLEVREAQ